MHDLKPITALGGAEPRTDTIGTVTIAENDGVSLASVAARLGQEAACQKGIKSCTKPLPFWIHEVRGTNFDLNIN
ncbi:MAG: hypothetical protein AAFQ09_09650, partial [Pseudomonadota bacterium]